MHDIKIIFIKTIDILQLRILSILALFHFILNFSIKYLCTDGVLVYVHV